jgi:hypothetical protein
MRNPGRLARSPDRSALSAAEDPAGVAFFEQKIRPVLAETATSATARRRRSSRAASDLDSKAGWEQGGDSGKAVIIPANPRRAC